MSNSGAKVFIQVESEAEQQEHLKNQRKTLKIIQGNAYDKENKILTGREQTPLDKISRLKAAVASNAVGLATPEYGKRKRVETKTVEVSIAKCNTETQTNESAIAEEAADRPITAKDLTSDCEPGENYYKRLAEKRRVVLEETLKENQHLNERIEGLEEELSTMRQELQEAHHLAEVLKEIIAENETSDEETKVAEDDNADLPEGDDSSSE